MNAAERIFADFQPVHERAMRGLSAKKIQYSPQIDAIIYGEATTGIDFIALAMACLDQAGLSARMQDNIETLVRSEEPGPAPAGRAES